MNADREKFSLESRIEIRSYRVLYFGIKISLYEAFFGCKVKVGFSTFNLPKEVIDNLENEEQLL
jgi:hypothetical protein